MGGDRINNINFTMLVAFYGNKHSLEAAWKYLIMGVVGIALALLGIVFIYLSGLTVLLEEQSALQWTNLLSVAGQLNAEWVKVGFIFILIGFGTKSGRRQCIFGYRMPIVRPQRQLVQCYLGYC